MFYWRYIWHEDSPDIHMFYEIVIQSLKSEK